ncbi:glutamate receptor 4-like isoform X2 [Acanthaster planci]|uniref:Glutamate receptor 4-like isoform X2 n=1 Tax=Acanthaster planci TaxID=133434 RepID=A0A8B7XZB8_ACAPL|nr:glutamate receptor 4-like isoform X2 [Acanthaster planci]
MQCERNTTLRELGASSVENAWWTKRLFSPQKIVCSIPKCDTKIASVDLSPCGQLPTLLSGMGTSRALQPGSWFPLICVFCLIARCQVTCLPYIQIGAIFADNPNASFLGFKRAIFYQNGLNDSFQFACLVKSVSSSNSFEMAQKVCSLFSIGKGALLISADVEPPLIGTAASYSGTFQMPIIIPSLSKRDLGYQTKDPSTKYLVSLMPSLVPVLFDVIQFRQWTRFAFIYDSDKGLLRLHALMEKLSFRKFDVAFRKAEGEVSMIQILREFRDSDYHRIICDTNVANTRLLMEKIPLLGMLTSSYHYIFLDLDIGKVNLEKFQLGGMNITGFSIVNETSQRFQLLKTYYEELRRNNMSITRNMEYVSYRSALMMDLVNVMAKTMYILIRDNKFKLFKDRGQRSCGSDGSRHWGIDKTVLKSLKTVSFDGASGPVSFDSFGERSNYVVRILNLFSNGMREVGTWQSDAKTRLKFSAGAYGDGTDRVDFNNKTIIVTSILEEPYMMRKEPRHLYSGNDRFHGYAIDLLEEIVKKFPFKYRIQLVRDNTYGILVNNTWNGMVGELVRGEADIAVAPLTIISDRERVIDFTKPFMSLGISIMIKKPHTTKPDVFSFMHPLSYEIWMCIVLAYAGVSVVLFLVSRFSPKEWYPVEYTRVPTDETNGASPSQGQTTNDFSITNSLWFSFGALMQQGSDISPRSLSGRIVGGVWWFFTLIIISSYTANLAAFLTVERMVTDIQSAQDLVNSKDVSYGMVGAGSTEEFFRQSNIPLYVDMWNYMNSTERSVLVTSNEQGVERVRHMNGKFAFLVESTLNEYFSQQKPCDTMKVGQNLDSKSYGIGVSRNFTTFRDDLTLAVLQLREEGVLDALKKRWWFDKGQCHEANSDSGSNALTLSNVAGVFYILVGGLALALLSAIVEFYCKSRSQSRKQKTSLAAAMRAKVRLSVTGENADLASQLHPKANTSAPSTETEARLVQQ